MKIKVGCIFGGRSVEHEVSIISAQQTMAAIDKTRYDVVPVYIDKEGVWYTGESLLDIDNFKNFPQLLSRCEKVFLPTHPGENCLVSPNPKLFRKKVIDRIDVAFPVLHGTNGEDGTLQGLLELMNLPYVGSDVLSSALGIDKIAMKIMLAGAGLPNTKYTCFHASDWIKDQAGLQKRVEEELGYPVIIKPATLGSSVGLGKAENAGELESAVDLARKFSQRILVEEMLTDFREINCSILGDHESVKASVCEEPVGSEAFLTYQDKYLNKGLKGMSGARRNIPAEIPDEISSAIQELAIRTFQLLNCHGVARVDILMDNKTGKILVNEINTIPGSLSFYLWEASGMTFTELTNELIRLALKRNREKNNLLFKYDSNILSLKSGKGLKGLK